MERDLFIRRMFTNTPLLWELLSLVAVYRPAICYCSVLLRALTATLIHQWKSMGEQSKNDDSENYRTLMDTTVKVIDIMALGQLLPPPLSSIRDVIPHLKCYEVSVGFINFYSRLHTARTYINNNIGLFILMLMRTFLIHTYVSY